MIRLTLPALLLSATAATADLAVQFDEGAPKDRFTITNTGDCPLPAMDLTLDLGTAPAGLIFDVTGAGAGVQVFQPFEMVAGGDALIEVPQVLDGDNAVRLRLNGLAAGAEVAFTVDVDDTGGGREITVSGSEIAGASVRMAMGGIMQSAVMDDTARAMLPLQACTS